MAEGAASITDALKSKQGKVVIVGGVAFVGYMYYRSRQAAASASAAGAATGSTDTSTLGGVDTGSGPGTYGTDQGSAASSSTVSNGITSPTNSSWLQSAVSYLSGLGRDPGTVADALGRYLSGDSTAADQSIIQTALGAVGPTPTPAPLQTGVASTTTTTTSNPGPTAGTTVTGGTAAKPVTYTVQKGDTQAKINQMFGIHIEALNPSLNHPGSKIKAGQKVIV